MDSQSAYDEQVKDILAGRRENYRQFDQAILTLSSGTFAISIAFLRDQHGTVLGDSRYLLVCSWFSFLLAISSTVISFLLVPAAAQTQVEYAAKWHLDGDDRFRMKRPMASRWIEGLNITAGVFFLIGLLLTAIFVTTNIR